MTLRSLLRAGAVGALLLIAVAGPAALAGDTGNPAPQTGRVVSDDPSGFTPHIMDGTVRSMTRVGDLIVVGGDFTRVRNAGSSTDIPRRNAFAFNVSTGQVSPTFAPNPNGTVYTVLAATDGRSVYLGGNFTSVTSAGSSVAVSRLYLADVATGARVATFQPGTINGQVRDLSVTGNRLWVAGKFTHLQGRPSRALGTLVATTGARDPYDDLELAGVHRGSTTNVQKIATDPTNGRLIAIGNFDTVDGVHRHQFAMLDISGPEPTLADYYTTQYESACSPAFETYLTDVQYSPDGSFFVVSTTGAYGGYSGSMAGTSGCDVVARFESTGSGTAVRPTWTAYTGGDTTWSVEVTDDVVYVGGHQRWQNNPARGDAPDEGAVSRPGIAALSSHNGLPYSWNPTRTLGVGVRDMIATPEGLFVGSDTDVFAGETHRRLAFLPLAGGTTLPERRDGSLPGDVYRVATNGSQLVRVPFDGTVTGAPVAAPNGSGWGTARGGFMVNGDLYTIADDRLLVKRSFDGTTYGPASTVATADALVPQDDWHNGDIPTITTLFFHRGWMYFTKAGSNQLFRRAFEPESGVVGQQLFSVPSVAGVTYGSLRGAFVADGALWFAGSTGSLSRADWGQHGAVAGTAATVQPPGSGWSSRALFLYQGPTVPAPVNEPPVADFTVSCTGLTCTADASASQDADGSITSYAWDFGDGTSTDGPAVLTHTYATDGARTVTLGVTDDDGATATTTRTAHPASTTTAGVTAVAATSTAGNRTAHTATVPPQVRAGDLLLAFLVANTTAPSYTAPPGWTEVQAVTAGAKAVGRLYVRTATATDAGQAVTVTSSGYAKSVLTVAAYRGENGSAQLGTSAAATLASSTTSATTPAVACGGGWLVSYWATKTSNDVAWSLPPEVTPRSSASATGSGRIVAALGDSAGPAAPGPCGGLVATTDASGNATVTFSAVIAGD